MKRCRWVDLRSDIYVKYHDLEWGVPVYDDRELFLLDLKNKYDYVLIDCMPSLGMITINALACADKVIIPVQSEFLAAKGMSHLMNTVIKVRKQINPEVLEYLASRFTNLTIQKIQTTKRI